MAKKYQALAVGGVIIIALIILSLFALGPKQTSLQPDLIEITNLTPNSITGHVVIWTDNSNAPSGFELEIGDEEYIWQGDQLDPEMPVLVLCSVEEFCSPWINETHTEMSFAEFVEAEKSCADMYAGGDGFCPYYNLGAFNLFDVTWEDGKIIELKQRYTP